MADLLNWDEFRIVRAIAEAQSLYGAAERLRLNHSTMFRRLTALESRLGLKLFERDRSGYRPTAAGEDMVSLATVMGDTIAEFERRVGRRDLRLSGTVRLSTPETLGCAVLPKLLADFRARHPGVQVELSIGQDLASLLSGHTDLGLRALSAPPPPDLAGKRIAGLPWAVYASPALAPVGEEADLASAPWVTLAPEVGPLEAHNWVGRHVEPARVAARVGSVMILAELAARGIGAALLPCFVGGSKRELLKIGEVAIGADDGVWLVAAPQALRKARVRALCDFLAEEIGRRRDGFEGVTPAAD